ncbi:reductive dehalogenase domain-containing protein [Oceanirhabdus sp. W0125-5]|uniref:reductive dehalogenase domain-containing protein n=1 Tax=Oceanirhabdus sp. W0125-5 TaxID=2999116 RepID=UPI0022F34497|nr:reductive dehalogenase domain-containing protein [Oceanirhabdus sp. W0125-5]WBW94680.1 reductive dehalogenase domain-containing protein [Oceanirhabdus sp. W0125-5]
MIKLIEKLIIIEVKKLKRFDERDHMFSRMNYKKGTKEYEDYYKRHPELKNIDDDLREMPELGGEGTVTFSNINSPIINANFRFLSDIKELSEGNINEVKQEIDVEKMNFKLKELAQIYGSDLIGICEMKEEFYYSHRGRESKHYGNKIKKFHKYGIVFAVELKKDFIMRAPQLPEAIATVKGYTDVGIIGMILSYYIRELGYDARNHMDGNYLAIAPLVAVEAGLGELGRSGLLVTKEFGPRVRLGIVTTDMPLTPDGKIDFGLQKFCEECGLCARTCPGKSISKTSKEMVDGVLRWKINMEECYRRWRSLGTDCGICLCNCPFSMGIEINKIDRIKTNPEIINDIIKEYKDEYGVRPIIRTKLPIEE